MVALPFTELADTIGATKVANIVMLGALLEATGMLPQNRVEGALRRLVAPRFLQLDFDALALGREEFLARSADGRLPRTSLIERVCRRFGVDSPQDLLTVVYDPSRDKRVSIKPPAGVNLMALVRRFVST